MQFWKGTLLFFLFLAGHPGYSSLHVDVESESALLINSKTGRVLFAKNASKPMYPASCTKIAFALYAIKYHRKLFDQTLVCSQNALKSLPESQKGKNNFADVPSYILENDASHMGLKVGEEMKFYDLLEATMVVSADDASNMIAETMGEGNVEKCVQDVNRYLTSLGCKNTHFTNPHGLHHPEHVTTAEDLALLCREAMKEPLFAKMAKMTSFQRPKTNIQEAVVLKQTNRLLTKGPSYYPAAVGIKTGYHRRAGYCLAAQAEENGRSLISITFHSDTVQGRFADTKKLFDAAFQEALEYRKLLEVGPQSFERSLKGGSCKVKTLTKEPIGVHFYPSDPPVISYRLAWYQVSLPLKKDSPVGELRVCVDGEVQQKTTLFAANDVELTFLSKLHQRLPLLIILGGIGAIFFALILLAKRRK